MKNENYYQEVIKQYLDADLSAEEAMEYLIQVRGLESKSYRPELYRKKRHFVVARNIFSRMFNIKTMTFTTGLIGLNIMYTMNRILNNQVNDIEMASKIVRVMMVEEVGLMLFTLVLYIAHEVKLLHRMGIKIFSLDFFRIIPKNEEAE